MSWDYADLSMKAKAAGGPEALTELLVQSGKDQMVPWVALFSAVSFGVGICITKAVEFFENRKEISDQDVETTRQKLLKEIKEYEVSGSK